MAQQLDEKHEDEDESMSIIIHNAKKADIPDNIQHNVWEYHGSNLQVNGNSVTHNKEKKNNSVYSKTVKSLFVQHEQNPKAIVPTAKRIEWKIKTHDATRSYYDFIGIIEQDHKQCEDIFFQKKNTRLKNVNWFGIKYPQGEVYSNKSDEFESYANGKLKRGDIITIDLNINEKTVSFWRNNKNLGVAFKNINVNGKSALNYRLAIYMYAAKHVFEFIECIVHVSAKDCDLKYLPVARSFEYIRKELEIANASLNRGLELMNNYKSSNFVDIDCLYSASNDIEQNEKFLENLENSTKQLKQAFSEAKKQVSQQLNPQTHQYKKWTLNEMIIWIRSLENGRFIKYSEKLKQYFQSDGITASDLPDLTRNDLRTFGIELFRDRVDLEKHFQNLAKQSSESDSKEGDKQNTAHN